MKYEYDNKFFEGTKKEIESKIRAYLHSKTMYINCVSASLGPESYFLGIARANETCIREYLILLAIKRFNESNKFFAGKWWKINELSNHLENTELRFLGDNTFNLAGHNRKFGICNMGIEHAKRLIIEEILNG
ncbi:MAG: hypothetical protein ACFFG0_08285 [Candidatus Thorarchaeota archaeon]